VDVVTDEQTLPAKFHQEYRAPLVGTISVMRRADSGNESCQQAG
jgi:hypothetical protein